MIKSILGVIKDILGLVFYIVVICCSVVAPIQILLFAAFYPEYTDPLLNSLDGFFAIIAGGNDSIFEIIASIPDLIFGVTIAILMVRLPMYVTRVALDRKWSRVLNFFFEKPICTIKIEPDKKWGRFFNAFFDKVQFSMLFLILLIILEFVFKYSGLWPITTIFLFIYLSALIKKVF